MLDAVRGLAAMWVVLFHLTLLVDGPGTGPARLLWDHVIGNGALGVAVFYVLSGFVITHSPRNGFGAAATPVNFMVRRIIRLTPPYWAAIVLAIAMHRLAVEVDGEPFLPGGAELTPGRLAAHLVYLTEVLGYVNLNDVFWTLAIEMQFYVAMIPITIAVTALARRLGHRAYPVATIVLGAVAVAAMLDPGDGRATTIGPFLYSFALGIAAYWVTSGIFWRLVEQPSERWSRSLRRSPVPVGR